MVSRTQRASRGQQTVWLFQALVPTVAAVALLSVAAEGTEGRVLALCAATLFVTWSGLRWRLFLLLRAGSPLNRETLLPGATGTLILAAWLTLSAALWVVEAVVGSTVPFMPWLFAYGTAGFAALGWVRYVRLRRLQR